jgi:hypothetical protein
MKSWPFILLAGLLVMFSACQTEKDAETEQVQQSAREGSATNTPAIPDLSDDYLVGIYEAQELIKIFHDEKSFREDYCKRAYLEDYDLFISMGIGRLTNPETGQSIPRHMARRAADLDARRWAGYGAQWLSSDYEPPFGELHTTFNKPVTVLGENVVGDSLFVFVATRMDLR